MARLVVRVRLFVGSYAPLFGIFALRFRERSIWIPCAVLAVWGFADMYRITRTLRRVKPTSLVIAAVQDRGGEVAGYIATYLLPFVTVSQPSGRDLLGYGLFLVVVGVIYVRSEMTQINPTLYLLGWRVVIVHTDSGWTRYAIVRSVPEPGDIIEAVQLQDEVIVGGRRIDGKGGGMAA